MRDGKLTGGLAHVLGVFASRREAGPLVVLVILAAVFQAGSGQFFTANQVEGFSSVGAAIAIVTAGVTLLMISGEFDLSVGATYAFTPIVMALLLTVWHVPDWLALTGALTLAMLVGVINGLVTTYFGIPSLITTLAMSFVVTGVNVYISNGATLLYYQSTTMMSLLGSKVGSLPIYAPFVWAIALTAVLWFVLEWTQYGGWSSAAGGRGPTGREMGIPISKVKVTNFALCSLITGFAGCTTFAYYGAVSSSYGQDYQLLAIVAAVVGGTSIFGVTGSIIGAFIGSLILGSLSTGLILIGAPGSWYHSFTGILLVVAVILNVRLSRVAHRLLQVGATRTARR